MIMRKGEATREGRREKGIPYEVFTYFFLPAKIAPSKKN